MLEMHAQLMLHGTAGAGEHQEGGALCGLPAPVCAVPEGKAGGEPGGD